MSLSDIMPIVPIYYVSIMSMYYVLFLCTMYVLCLYVYILCIMPM